MRRVSLLSVVLTLSFVFAACAPVATPTQVQIPTVAVPVTGNTVRAPAIIITATSARSAPTATAAAPAESPTAGTTTGTVTTGPVTDTSVRIGTSTSTSVSQPFLVDQTNRAVYLFTQDDPTSGTSACNADCEKTWLPVFVKGTPTAGPGVETSMLGTITREDGKMQASYNGWPLYYYSGDRGAGMRNGQGVDNSWFLVSATGNPIQK